MWAPVTGKRVFPEGGGGAARNKPVVLTHVVHPRPRRGAPQMPSTPPSRRSVGGLSQALPGFRPFSRQGHQPLVLRVLVQATRVFQEPGCGLQLRLHSTCT